MAHEDLTANSMGDVHGIGFQVETIQGDVHVTYASPAPSNITQPSCAPPADWTSTTDLPAEVQHLLWAQEQCADLLPYQLPGARKPSLGTVYVRQDVGSGVEGIQSEQRPAPTLDEDGQLVEVPPTPVVRVAVRPPSKPMRAALDNDDHLVITGGPGQGKSTLTLRLTADIVRQWAAKSPNEAPLTEPVIPLRLPARVLAEHLGPSFSAALADSVAAEYGHLLAEPLDPHLFATHVAGCRWLLLIDALDEVADPHTRVKIVHTLSAWAKKATYRVLLTTRPTELGDLAALQRVACRYELQPFDEVGLRLFAAHWFEDEGKDCANRFLQQIREAHLFELVEVPLLATIAAIVFEQHAQRPLPGNQYELYEAYIAYIRKPGSTPSGFERHRVPLIEHLGRTRLETDASLTSAVHTWAQEHPGAGSRDDLITNLKVSGLFVERGRDIAFLHHSFAEHIAATAKARELPTEFDAQHAAFADLLHRAQPLETGRFARAVLLHHTHLHPAEADRLLRWLHNGKAEQHLLAARLLAKHLPASAPLIEEFLTVVRGWALTTQYPAQAILGHASRASHYSGLGSWLVKLTQDELMPFESRVEAATALAVRLRDTYTTEALALLRSAVDDPAASVQHRLFAAEALAHSGSDERETAERGLRSVLCDPFASGRDCRNAGVVLAALGGDARDFAVSELNRLLSDVDTPNQDLVNVATALLEVGADFHERCANILLSVLTDPVNVTAGKRDAALGLVALGKQEAATDAIMDVVPDRLRPTGQQTYLLVTLAMLGPRMREAAADILVARLDASDTVFFGQKTYVEALVQVGQRDLAIEIARKLLADPSASLLDLVPVASALGTLGPAFHNEVAAHLHRACGYARMTPFEFTMPLRALANLTEPHQSRATALLRQALTDLRLDPQIRCEVASELITCAPQFHAIALEHLLLIASSEQDPDVRAKAWAKLHRLGPEQAERALAELLVLARDHGALSEFGLAFRTASAADKNTAAEVLIILAKDQQLGARTRMNATQGLIALGKPFHRVALTATIELLRGDLISEPLLLAQGFVSTGRGVRAELAAALGDLCSSQRLTPWNRWSAIRAIDVLGCEVPLSALRSLACDESADLIVRAEAAVQLTKTDPGQLDTAADLVFAAPQKITVRRWKQMVGHLAQLGVDVHARLRQIVTSPDSACLATAKAASLMAPATLHAISEDQYSPFRTRLNSYRLWETRKNHTLHSYLMAILNDPDQPIADRCSAVAELAELDPSMQNQATQTVRRFAENPRLRVAERIEAVNALASLLQEGFSPLPSLINALAHAPERSDEDAASLVAWLPRTERTSIERLMLADQSITVEHRLPEVDFWGDAPLRGEVEAAVREVLRSPEYSKVEHRKALAALARYSPQHADASISLLVAEGSAEALKEAAKLGAWHQVRTRLHAIVMNDGLPIRERRAAALAIGKVAISSSVRNFLRNDAQASWRDRVDELSFIEAFDDLRSIRDDRTLPPHFRRRAARLLVNFSINDRVACAQAFSSIASDASVPPALRHWAATDLTDLGARGRAEALQFLDAMARDECFPVIVRSDVADTIGTTWPTKRDEMLELQRGLLPLAEPLQRVHVLRDIGAIRVHEGVDGLNAMTADTDIGPVVRLWAAIRMFELRRDTRERAAVVAREIAFDTTVPAHVRRRAAQKLARWSEVCRQDARGLLHTLILPC